MPAYFGDSSLPIQTVAFLDGGPPHSARADKRINDDAANWSNEPGKSAHERQRLNRWMILAIPALFSPPVFWWAPISATSSAHRREFSELKTKKKATTPVSTGRP